jgi:hypothetical protein
MTDILNNGNPADYKLAFTEMYESYMEMSADYTVFFLQMEGSDYFKKNTAKRLKIAKNALIVFEQEKNYEKLSLVYLAVEEFLKNDDSL